MISMYHCYRWFLVYSWTWSTRRYSMSTGVDRWIPWPRLKIWRGWLSVVSSTWSMWIWSSLQGVKIVIGSRFPWMVRSNSSCTAPNEYTYHSYRLSPLRSGSYGGVKNCFQNCIPTLSSAAQWAKVLGFIDPSFLDRFFNHEIGQTPDFLRRSPIQNQLNYPHKQTWSRNSKENPIWGDCIIHTVCSHHFQR